MNLRLEFASDGDFEWLLGRREDARGLTIAPDLAPPEVLEIVRGLAANWLVIDKGEVVGIIGLKCERADGEAEVGYGVAASREGRGFTSAAVAALIPIVRRRGVRRLNAETSVDNPASQRVLKRNGFVRNGERVDEEDGPVIMWTREI